MNRNTYMAILIGVTALCMIIGTLHNVMGMFRFSRKMEDMPVEISRELTDENTEGKEVEAEILPKEEAEGLQKITADIELADLVFQTGEELHVDYKGDERFEPKVTEKNGALTITQHVETKWINVFKKENRKGIQITVTIPEGTELEELKTSLNLGDTKLDRVKAVNCTLDSDLGDIRCEDCEFTGIKILSSLGDVHVKNSLFEDMDVRQDMGDVNISTQQDLSDSDLNLETDLGDVRVNGKDQESRFSLSGSSGIRVVVENDMGDIRLEYAA